MLRRLVLIASLSTLVGCGGADDASVRTPDAPSPQAPGGVSGTVASTSAGSTSAGAPNGGAGAAGTASGVSGTTSTAAGSTSMSGGAAGLSGMTSVSEGGLMDSPAGGSSDLPAGGQSQEPAGGQSQEPAGGNGGADEPGAGGTGFGMAGVGGGQPPMNTAGMDQGAGGSMMMPEPDPDPDPTLSGDWQGDYTVTMYGAEDCPQYGYQDAYSVNDGTCVSGGQVALNSDNRSYYGAPGDLSSIWGGPECVQQNGGFPACPGQDNCGQCFEIRCDPDGTHTYPGDTDPHGAFCRTDQSVVIQVVDACPHNHPQNTFWCTSERPDHVDISCTAFRAISQGRDVGDIGSLNVFIRQVDCGVGLGPQPL